MIYRTEVSIVILYRGTLLMIYVISSVLQQKITNIQLATSDSSDVLKNIQSETKFQ